MFKARNQTEILTELKNNSIANTSSYEGSFQYDMLASNSIEFAKTEIEIETLYNMLFARTSKGEYLTMLAEQFGVIRKSATHSTGFLTIKGNGRLPAGSVFSTENGILFKTLKEINIDGIAKVYAEALNSGEIGNVKENTIINIPASIVGIESVNNEKPFVGGYEVESDEELKQRYLFKVRNPATSGNKNHYELWAREVAGVGGARCIPLWQGNGTVKLIIVDKNLQKAEKTLLDEVQKELNEKIPVGATLTVVSAEPKKINISFKVLGKISEKELKEKITLYFKDIGFNNGYISIAKIGKIILECTGVNDYTDLRLNNNTENIPLTHEELPYIGEVVFNNE